jgi:predicted DNA-binding transcriptional regulator AlpA
MPTLGRNFLMPEKFDFLTVDQLAKEVGCCPHTIYRRTKRGELPHRNAAGCYFFAPDLPARIKSGEVMPGWYARWKRNLC